MLPFGGDREGPGGGMGAHICSAMPSRVICWPHEEHVIVGSCDICPSSPAGRIESCAAIEGTEPGKRSTPRGECRGRQQGGDFEVKLSTKQTQLRHRI